MDDFDDGTAIAVVGMGLACPGASSPEEFWHLRLDGRVMFTEPGDRFDLSAFHSSDPTAVDKTYSRKAGYISGFRPAPALASEVAETGDGSAGPEYTRLWLRHATMQCLEDVRRRDTDSYTCFIGYTADGSQHLEEALVAAGVRAGLLDRLPEAGLAHLAEPLRAVLRTALPRAHDTTSWTALAHVVGRRSIEGVLPAGTPVTMVDTACSSSLYSVDLGIKALLAGDADIALCGGGYAMSPRNPVSFAPLGLTPSDTVRAFDRAADGVLFADGAGMVALKTLRRARADGDRVLGVVVGFGTSTDGRGRSIYAPNPLGQRLAVDRAQHAAGIGREDVEWVVAHGTGTLAGDHVEYETLRHTVGAHDRPCRVTSNKSQVGHLGWAAGIISFIEMVLGLSHGTIPPQHQFERLPDTIEPDPRLAIGTTAAPWAPRTDRPRVGGVSSFGLGGTNAHVIVSDRPTRRTPGPPSSSTSPTSPTSPTERIAVVDWSAHVPGAPDRDAVAAWLCGRAPDPPDTFGPRYELPPFEVLRRYRVTPRTAREMDRTQHMALECAARLDDRVVTFWSRRRSRIGVFAASTGPTHVSVTYGLRCYLRYLEQLIDATPALRDEPRFTALLARFRGEVHALAGPANKELLTGGLSSITASRVASVHDFHGATMALLGGPAAPLEAIAAAGQYLRAGDLDLALVCGVHGNTTPALHSVLNAGDRDLGIRTAEGAFMLALATESTARRHGLPILGFVSPRDSGATGGPLTDRALPTVDCSPVGRRSYLGAEAVKATIEALLAGQSRSIECTDPYTARTDVLDVHVVPALDTVTRHAVRLQPRPAMLAAPEPADDTATTLALTADPGATAVLAARGVRTVLGPDAVGASAFARPAHRVERLLVVVRAGDPDLALRVHDALFLLLRHYHDELAEGRLDFRVLLLDAVCDGVAHPDSGLFTGLARSMGWEYPGCHVRALVAATSDADAGLRLLDREAAAPDEPPVVVHDGVRRMAPTAHEEPVTVGSAGPIDVVVATGGARGATAEILVELARQHRPRIWVMGRTDLDGQPGWVSQLDDASFEVRCARHLRAFTVDHPDRPPVEGKRAVERLRAAREALANLARMARHSGPDRVHYLCCDVTDGADVERAAGRILADGSGIDLLLHAAAVHRPASTARKHLDEFRTIRDVKVVGHRNLTHAFRNHRPRIWANFGSVVGFVGQPGELDYASGNDFLATAAARQHAAGFREFTVHWPLWRSVGAAADPLTQTFLQRRSGYAGLETSDGVSVFLAELHADPRDAVTLLLPRSQRRAVDAGRPGLFGDRPARGAVLGPLPAPVGTRLVAQTSFAPLWVNDHLVRGVPSLAGALLLECAAEAASRLVPGRTVTEFTGTRFVAFVRQRRDRGPRTHQVVAEILDETHSRVRVRVLSDVSAPDGLVLRRNRLHFETTVHLADALPTGPVNPDGRLPETVADLPDPYFVPNDVLQLSGVFPAIRSGRRHADGASGTYLATSVSPSGMRVPAMLIDAVLRTAALGTASDVAMPIAVPASVKRVSLYQAREDTPSSARLRAVRTATDEITLTATDPTGAVVVEVTGMEAVPMAFLDLRDGTVTTAMSDVESRWAELVTAGPR